MIKVFLGGTCNGSSWREELEKQLSVDYFDPVVDDWNDEARENELREREEADFVLYVFTPRMTGVYAIAEVVDDSNKRPNKTLFYCMYVDDGYYFSPGQKRSLKAVAKMVENNGGKVFYTLTGVAAYLNKFSEEME